MNLIDKQEIIQKMQELKSKWKEPPKKGSAEWWRYRADQSYYLYLKSKLKTEK